MRKQWRADFTEAEAKKLLEDCLEVLFYRFTRASTKVLLHSVILSAHSVREMHIPQVQFSKVTSEGATVMDPYRIEQKWECKAFANTEYSPFW